MAESSEIWRREDLKNGMRQVLEQTIEERVERYLEVARAGPAQSDRSRNHRARDLRGQLRQRECGSDPTTLLGSSGRRNDFSVSTESLDRSLIVR